MMSVLYIHGLLKLSLSLACISFEPSFCLGMPSFPLFLHADCVQAVETVCAWACFLTEPSLNESLSSQF